MKEKIFNAFIFAVLVVVFWNILDALYTLIISRGPFVFTLYNNILFPLIVGMFVALVTGLRKDD